MINLPIHPLCKRLMDTIGATVAEAATTVNNRHHGLVSNKAIRLSAIHWFSPDRAIMVDGPISKSSRIAGKAAFRIEAVTPNIVIVLRPQLPAGKIDRDTDMETVMAVVAESFGFPLRGHPDEPWSTLYSGPWNGKPFEVLPPKGHTEYATCGSFSPQTKYAEMVYAFVPKSYTAWLTGTQSSSPSN
jgi:hypothetical protein